MIFAVTCQVVGLGVERLKTSCRGSEGAKPTGKFSVGGKAERLFRWSGALWLAIMRNLPNPPLMLHTLSRHRPGGLVVLRFARKRVTDDVLESMDISSGME